MNCFRCMVDWRKAVRSRSCQRDQHLYPSKQPRYYSSYFYPLQNLPFISPSPLAHHQWGFSKKIWRFIKYPTQRGVLINPFHATDLFWYPLKTSENHRFSDAFRGYQKRSVAGNGLKAKTQRRRCGCLRLKAWERNILE